ncbi:T9SS ring complex lipoprotein PorK/GldK [Solitalea koreensis]|uniref:Gliding motility-associated lipoprotein GldK/gliding motility-associated lipoprotein GldK,TIGR03529 n=1 Tax=Solitalea koreensis TaxID=543615 RepID=A0A521AUG5_9SPHI|nr:SUMF1/EgtB/PvdO family nonheme iron enzyme [Solitalea koreensis]SMO38444.1 gliding motility-associated lipoprotein GldK/gliding motility-associated lipoprotein GldK,TIGR03529 [Solitalea koreensis]
MKYLWLLCSSALLLSVSGCGSSGARGELVGIQGRKPYKTDVPYGMVYIPAGTFIMGQSDQDITSSQTAQNRQVTIAPFYMDETEITNNEYRQFVYWVRDSIAAKMMGGDYIIKGDDGTEFINPKKPLVYGTKKGKKSVGGDSGSDNLNGMYYQGDDQIYGKKEFDVTKFVYQYTWFDFRAAALKQNRTKARTSFIKREKVQIYPDTLVWLADFSYAQNEPMVEQYFSHPAFDNYPVVGVTWKQANAFAAWRTEFNNSYKDKSKKPRRGSVSLPTEAQFEYAARGGRIGTDYPWGGPYIRNSKGCLLANFKPGRGNYADDGGFYTVNVKSYFPNDYGLYNMAGNVAEWTSSTYDESSYTFVHDMNPTYTTQESDNASLSQKRKVVRGGSWKDIGFFLQNGIRSYEYQDTAKSYIGFRCIVSYMGKPITK